MQVMNEQDQQTLARLHGEYLADDKGVRTTSAAQLQDDAYALGYKRAELTLAGASVRVTAEGVSFGNSWFSHEAITGRTAEQLNSGQCGIIGREYMKWVDSSLNPEVIANQAPATGIHSADPLACSGCVSGCLRCSVDVQADDSTVEAVIAHMDSVWSGEADEDITDELCRQLRVYAEAADKARALLAKVMQNHVTALPLAIRAEIEAVIA
jgi:hypothetical protein